MDTTTGQAALQELVIAGLEQARRAQLDATDELAASVALARNLGVTDARIAAALGVSKQAVHQFRHRREP